jgi:hypothetical protein
MTVRLRVSLAIAFAAALFLPQIAWASGAGVHDVVIGRSFTLPAGGHFTGNLIAIGSAVSLAQDSTFEGDIVLVGGSFDSAGAILGQVATIGGTVHFASTATVSEDVAVIGSAPQMDPGAKIRGSLKSVGAVPRSDFYSTKPPSNAIFPADFFLGGFAPGKIDPLYEGTALLFKVLLLSAIAVLVVLFLPVPTRRVAQTIVGQPAISFLIGMLALVAMAALLLLLAFTICLSPFSLLGMFILLAAVLMGWVALGSKTGEGVAAILGAKWHPALQAGVGTMILTVVASGVGYIPCAGSLLVILFLSFGLGAVVLTRFGGQDYQTGRKEIASGLTQPDVRD